MPCCLMLPAEHHQTQNDQLLRCLPPDSHLLLCCAVRCMPGQRTSPQHANVPMSPDTCSCSWHTVEDAMSVDARPSQVAWANAVSWVGGRQALDYMNCWSATWYVCVASVMLHMQAAHRTASLNKYSVSAHVVGACSVWVCVSTGNGASNRPGTPLAATLCRKYM